MNFKDRNAIRCLNVRDRVEVIPKKTMGSPFPILSFECERPWNKQPDRKKNAKKTILHNSNFCTLLNSKEVDYGRDY